VSSDRIAARQGRLTCVGRGCFVFVVGPSGAGKDTLIEGARARLAGDGRFVFVRRAVTRPSGQWESHHSLSHAEFAEADRNGAFAFTWAAHGLQYGVPAEAVALVHQGKVVVCNGSRAAFATVLSIFHYPKLVLITASRELRMARLSARGRETDLADRLDRLADEDFQGIADLIIENEGAVAVATERLVAYLKQQADSRLGL
jgi:ribose 1,5-bisphosphokinase